MYGCESWQIKKAEYQRIDDVELWCWRTFLRVCWTGHMSLVIANTLFQPHKKTLCVDITGCSIPKSDLLYILCSQRWKISIHSAKTRPGPDCGSDHKLLNTKFRLKLKKVGKTTRSLRHDINQIPYDYIVEVTNRLRD